MLLVGDSAHRADPPATHNVATLNPVGFLASRRPPCFPGSLDCFLPQISTTTGESFLRGLRRTKSVPAGGPAGIELPMPWMLEMGHGGLGSLPPGSGRQTRPNSACPLAFLAEYMSIAKYCLPSQQSTTSQLHPSIARVPLSGRDDAEPRYESRAAINQRWRPTRIAENSWPASWQLVDHPRLGEEAHFLAF